MAKKNVNILLSLKDQFTPKLQGTRAEIRKQKRDLNAASKVINRWADNASKQFKRVAKVAAGVGFGAVLAGLKTGLSEAFDLEGYKMQLETATKDTEKAAKIMKYAIDLANKTPFEGGELVEGAAKFEAMGMSAEKWLTKAGDMAAATNKSFDQSVEALIDAQAGELERLKEFGIKKDQIVAKGEEMFANTQIVNNKGQIVNQEKFNEAMMALMEDKFTGGMEKQATTVRGMLSTIKGVTKNALANIVGMQSDGTLKAGSMLDTLKDKVKVLADKFTEWQSDGTLDKIGEKANDAFGKINNAISWVIDHADTLLPVLKNVVLAFVGFSVVSNVANKIKAVHDTFSILKGGVQVLVPAIKSLSVVTKIQAAAQGVLNAVMNANPVMLIVLAVVALIAIFVVLYKKCEGFRNLVKYVVGGVIDFITTLKDAFVLLGTTIKDSIVGAFDWVKDKVTAVFDWFEEKIGWIKDGVKGIGDALGFGKEQTNQFAVPGHATGTPYFKGGLTRINEGGRGEIVNLPNGTQIIPHDVAKNSVGGSNVTVKVVVQGNVIGNREYMEQTGNYVATKVIKALGVV